MIGLAESSSISTTAHDVLLWQGGLLETPTMGWCAFADPVRSRVIPTTKWGGTFELSSLWELGPLKTLLRLRDLPHGWDGAGSPPPTNAALSSSFQLVRLIGDIAHDALPEPHVVPLTRGGVQFEWRSGNRDLEIAVFADGTIEFITAENGDPQSEGPLSALYEMRSLFTWLTAAA